MNKKINPLWWLKNEDDPVPPDWYMAGSSQRKRNTWWLMRNPLHNFTFYVIGMADKPFTSSGKYPDDVFNPKGGWNWSVRRYKWISLPFVSYKGKVKFYAGWRERGNIGFKLTGNNA